ncbi:MAG: sulfotransferase [Isosphaeraceae bacterium]
MNCKVARKDALTPGASQLMDAEIIIVSGLPRSGTSLMMQMLASGGLKTVTDNVRTADTDNPRGYYELEKVKKIKDDASWLPETRGKAFKMVSQLLFDLPPNERYRIIFMERDLDEMLVSQEAMLQRRARAAGPREEIKRAFEKHLERLRDWLAEQPNMQVLYVKYSDLVKGPEEQSRRVSEFLSGKAEPKAMAAAVDPALYRNRKPGDGRS